jgi:hypothetical protein
LFDFFQGSLHLLAIVDFAVLCAIAADKGYTAEFDPENSDYPFRYTKTGRDNWARISEHILARVAYEFTSPRWIINAGIQGYEANMRRALAVQVSTEAVAPSEE